MSDVPAVEVTNLHKRFGPFEVLKGVTLAAHKGEVISILGASGSGKSTLLRCINFLEVPDDGEVRVAGEALRTRPARGGHRRAADQRQVDRVRTELGFVFQSFNLWSHMTVLENVIECPIHVQGRPRAEAIAAAEALLEKVGIADKRNHYPAHLSGGQQQRVAIARAIALEPRVMLFDEPTSALDPELVGGVLQVMRELREDGMTMVVVSHEMGFARAAADRVVFMADGLVLEEGAPAEIFGAPRQDRTRAFISQITRH